MKMKNTGMVNAPINSQAFQYFILPAVRKRGKPKNSMVKIQEIIAYKINLNLNPFFLLSLAATFFLLHSYNTTSANKST